MNMSERAKGLTSSLRTYVVTMAVVELTGIEIRVWIYWREVMTKCQVWLSMVELNAH